MGWDRRSLIKVCILGVVLIDIGQCEMSTICVRFVLFVVGY